MILPNYQFFGSQDSLDIDVTFFVNQIPDSIAESAKHTGQYCQILAEKHQFTRPVNGNLVILEDGHLTAVFKGTIDELNNALFHTYSLHHQYFENAIQVLLKRDVDLKFLRSARVILSYFTKTSQRKAVKNALNGDIDLKYEVLKSLNLIDLLANEMQSLDVMKSIAFQMGQALALDNGQELFSKKAIGEYFPILKPYLNREKLTDLSALNDILQVFLERLHERKKSMPHKFEYVYRFSD